LSTLSGGEAARLVFARMQVEQPNVLVLDEPTNHLDLESIEALVAGLRNYDGTLILVSHDRWFVNQLATRVVEISRIGIRDYHGTYEEYVHDCGDDHLDTDNVVLKTKRNEKKARAGSGERGGTGPNASGALTTAKRAGNGSDGVARGAAARRDIVRAREDRLARIAAEIESAESAIATIDRAFASAGYFENTPGEQIRAKQTERAGLELNVQQLMEEWEQLERESQAVG
jgi:energy-coupling factor transporter ATP-binding protein EcfA2